MCSYMQRNLPVYLFQMTYSKNTPKVAILRRCNTFYIQLPNKCLQRLTTNNNGMQHFLQFDKQKLYTYTHIVYTHFTHFCKTLTSKSNIEKKNPDRIHEVKQ